MRVRVRLSREDVLVNLFAYLSVAFFAAVTLLPFMNVVSKAFSADWAVTSGKVGLFPIEPQLRSIRLVAQNTRFLQSLLISVYVTALGTFVSILMTALAAYPLSKKRLPLIKPLLVIYIFTMMFSGGIIPTYLLVRSLGLLNRLGSLILPVMINVFYMLLVKNYFENLPESLEESARIDGASNLLVLFRIVLPISKPALATVALFYAVSFWNDYFFAMIYITVTRLKPLQLYLREIVLAIDSINLQMPENTFEQEQATFSPQGVIAATMVASMVPMILVYPWLQRYFVKGILIGSVKG